MLEKKPVAVFRALSHQTRVQILQLLVRTNGQGLRSGEIASQLNIPASAASHHLFILRKIGLIVRCNDGRANRYSLNIARNNDLGVFLAWAREAR